MTGLERFTWVNRSPLLEAAQSTAFDPVLEVLSACLHLHLVFITTKFTSANAIRNLLQLGPATDLCLAVTPDQWLAVADEIRLGRCRRKALGTRALDVPKFNFYGYGSCQSGSKRDSR
jgi:hypothetical protein